MAYMILLSNHRLTHCLQRGKLGAGMIRLHVCVIGKTLNTLSFLIYLSSDLELYIKKEKRFRNKMPVPSWIIENICLSLLQKDYIKKN